MKEVDENSVAYRLRSLRAKKGMSQQEVYEATGVSCKSQSKYESGANASLHTLRKLADFYNIPLQELLEGKKPTPARPPEQEYTWLQVLREAEESGLTPYQVHMMIESLKRIKDAQN